MIYSPPFSKRRTQIIAENYVCTIMWNTWKMWNTSFLCFIKYNYVIHVQSSMNVTNHFILDPSEWGAGPYTSEWINEKGILLLLFKLNGNNAWWLLAWIHVSHLNIASLTCENILGNKCFRYKKDGYLKRRCHSQIECSLILVCFTLLAISILQSSMQ